MLVSSLVDNRVVFIPIPSDEFKIAMKALAPELNDDDIRVIFRAVDINNDNEITYTEFLAATLDPMELDVGAISRAFQLMDVNGDGFITAEELSKVLAVKMSDQHSSKVVGGGDGGANFGKKKAVPFVPSPAIPELPFLDSKPKITRISGKSLSVGSLARNASMRGQQILVSSAKSMMNLLSIPMRPDDDLDNNNNHRFEGRLAGKAGDLDEIDQRAMTMEERIKELMEACDVDKDGVISYAEFLWAMTGAKDILGDINALGPQKGNLPENFICDRQLLSVIESQSSELSLPQSIALQPLLDDGTPFISKIEMSAAAQSPGSLLRMNSMNTFISSAVSNVVVVGPTNISAGPAANTNLVLEDFAAPSGQCKLLSCNNDARVLLTHSVYLLLVVVVVVVVVVDCVVSQIHDNSSEKNSLERGKHDGILTAY